MHVRSVHSLLLILKRRHSSITGIDLPLRLMTLFTYSGVCVTGVTRIIPMISLTLRIRIPYSLRSREKVRYLPSLSTVELLTAQVCVLITSASFFGVFWNVPGALFSRKDHIRAELEKFDRRQRNKELVFHNNSNVEKRRWSAWHSIFY